MDLHFGNIKSLGDVIKEWVEAHEGMQPKLQEACIARDWSKIAGNSTARHTADLFLRNGTLTVRLRSAALRSELHMRRSAIADRVNEYYGREVVNKVIIR